MDPLAIFNQEMFTIRYILMYAIYRKAMNDIMKISRSNWNIPCPRKDGIAYNQIMGMIKKWRISKQLHEKNYKYIENLKELVAKQDIHNTWSNKQGIWHYLNKILPNLYDDKDMNF